MTRGCLRSALAAAAVVLATGTVHAQASPDEDAARTLFKEGLALHGARNFASALDKYREAYARWKNPKILANIGTAAWELGRFVEAANAYDEFLSLAPPEEPTRPEVEKALRDVIPKIGTLRIRAAPGAAIAVDGTPIAPSRLDRVRVEPGEHVVTATPSGRAVVTVGAGATAQVALAAEPAPEAAKPQERERKPRAPLAVLPWVVGGVGAAGLAASGVFLILRGDAVRTLERNCIDDVCPESSRDKLDSANTLGTLGLISLGVGAVGIGAAVFIGTRSTPEAGPASEGTRAGVLHVRVAASGGGFAASAGAAF